LFDIHQKIDAFNEDERIRGGEKIIGTTKKGIGPCYSTKTSRVGLRVGDIYFPETFETKFRNLVKFMTRGVPENIYGGESYIQSELIAYKEYAKKLKPYVIDTVPYLNESRKKGKKVLIEGANATMLDIDFGTYPFVTSSNPSMGGCISGLGIPPTQIGNVYGVMKAFSTRVGAGPFVTEMVGDQQEIGDKLRIIGGEFGTVTKRPRRVGWLDVVVMRYTQLINGFSSINLTKLDCLSDLNEIKLCTGYSYKGEKLKDYPSNIEVLEKCSPIYETMKGWKKDISKCRTMSSLPLEAQKYVSRIEELAEVHIEWVGVGVDRVDMVHNPKK